MQQPETARIGYCANVHPGTTLEQVKDNLEQYSAKIRQTFSPQRDMGIGLWLSATVLEQLSSPQEVENFRRYMQERGLVPFTFNGFPYGNFHQAVVKHNVYLPTWAETTRLDYTVQLAKLQIELLPSAQTSTISTVPIGWPTGDDAAVKTAAAENFRECVRQLAEIEASSGHHVRVAIEPEPGCLLDTAEDVAEYFTRYLLTGTDKVDETILRHLTVCHDVCHSAVMFESQQHAIELYRQQGISIGKVQVSSAVEVDFSQLDAEERQQAFAQLQEFNEPKYLHQTCIRAADNPEVEFFEDLSLAIDAVSTTTPHGIWRVHFHVPIFAERLRSIGTTQHEIKECLRHLGDDVTDFEVETYAWNVLPESQRNDSLINGIAKELSWFANAR